MLFAREFKAGIRAGRITRTYRIWRRPQAKRGGQYNLAPDGVIEVDGLSTIEALAINDRDARKAGFDHAAALLDYLGAAPHRLIYQIDFHYLGPGLVRQPDRNRATKEGVSSLLDKLDRMDARAARPWTRKALTLIGDHPGTRSGDLAPAMGWETARFKQQIRKLKALGLTVSLDTGYRLSTRGKQLLDRLHGS